MRRRTVLIAVGSLAAVVLAVGIPWTVSAVRGDRRSTVASDPGAHSEPGARSGPGITIGSRQPGAYQLVATRPRSGATSAADAAAVSAAEQDLTVALLRTLHPSGNVAVSPAGLALALSMLQNGAQGRTLGELHTALRTGTLTPAQIDSGWAAITRAWSDAAEASGIALSSANSIWTQRGLVVRAAFLGALDTWYRAGVWQTDFTTPAAVQAINAWTSRTTGGRIPALFDSLPHDTKAVLADAISFKADWATPFLPAATSTGRFDTGDTSVPTHYMSRTGQLSASVTTGYTAVELPYRGGRFSALAVQPGAGSSLAELVAGLDGASLHRIVAGLRTQAVDLRMPRFTVTSTLDLDDALTSLGMRTAFSDAADFGALSPTALRVGRVVQRVYLSVGEKGTEAAAATGVAMLPSSAMANVVTIALDHPFLFLVRDTTTGAIVFAAEVHRPQA